MDTQRPPKKTARVYGKKKQVSKSAGIFLQDSSPAPQKGGGRVEEEKEVEKTVTTAEVESRNEGNDNEKPVRRSTRKSSPVKSDSNAEPGLDARADANATPRKLKSSRKKKKKTDTKESDNVDNEPAAVAHKEPKAPKSPAKSPTKAKAASDPDVLADLTQTLNALQIAPTSPPATQPPPSKTHRARRPRTSGVPPSAPKQPPTAVPTVAAPAWLAPLPFPLPWSHLLHPSWPLTKLTESSYAEIYTLHNPSGSSILKILSLRPPRGPGSRRETACKVEDVLSEVAILDLVTEVPGFVVFRGVFVAKGGVPRGVVEAWEGWNDKPPGADASAEESEAWDAGEGRSAFPHPSRYHKDQLFLVLELGNAGKDLEHYNLTTREELWDVFLGTAMALATGEDLFGFEHRDLHEGNICLRRAAPATVLPKGNSADPNRYGFSGLEITLLDYTLSRARTSEGKTLFLDLDDPENAALFEDCEPGTKEQERKQRRVYSAMREHVVAQEKQEGVAKKEAKGEESRWAKHHPYTNVLWLAYVLEYSISHFEGPKSALKMFEEEVAAVRARLGKGKGGWGSVADVREELWVRGWVGLEEEEEVEGE
ncbi:hypothetical protein V497_02815 [Pseudogymnoascus sp. VKM F-4516 (FW-969)]|nr:hypothetical protein V497_02815 [Pseudogymnoascus sp. VKM F-4516 (FW-969)]